MARAPTNDMSANRHEPFVHPVTFQDDLLEGDGLGDPYFELIISASWDAPAPLLALANADAFSDGINFAVVDGSMVATIQAEQATIEALPAAPEQGTDAVLYQSFYVTPHGGLRRCEWRGKFTIVAGA